MTTTTASPTGQLSNAAQVRSAGGATSYEPVRQIIARHSASLDGVELVVKAVLDEIGADPDRLRAALAELLPDYCGTVIRQKRNGARIPPRSPKVQGIRDWYQRYITLQLHTSAGWKRIGDCTSADLLFAAKERRAQVQKTLSTAAEFERLAEAINSNRKARKVSDLAPEVVRAAVEGAR